MLLVARTACEDVDWPSAPLDSCATTVPVACNMHLQGAGHQLCKDASMDCAPFAHDQLSVASCVSFWSDAPSVNCTSFAYDQPSVAPHVFFDGDAPVHDTTFVNCNILGHEQLSMLSQPHADSVRNVPCCGAFVTDRARSMQDALSAGFDGLAVIDFVVQ